MRAQSEFSFGAGDHEDGLAAWRKRREDAFRELARRAGLPLGHEVEAWLRGGVRLKGLLELEEAVMFPEREHPSDLRLRIDGVTFRIAEMESCVRRD